MLTVCDRFVTFVAITAKTGIELPSSIRVFSSAS